MLKSLPLLLTAICVLLAGCKNHTSPSPQLFQPKDEQERQIQRLIESFIAAHESWERDAYRKNETPGNVDGNILTKAGIENLNAIQKSYQKKTLQPFFVKSAALRVQGFGVPVRHEAAFEKIYSLVARDDQFVVRTRMTRQNGSASFTEEFEYLIVIEDDVPKIESLEWIGVD